MGKCSGSTNSNEAHASQHEYHWELAEGDCEKALSLEISSLQFSSPIEAVATPHLAWHRKLDASLLLLRIIARLASTCCTSSCFSAISSKSLLRCSRFALASFFKSAFCPHCFMLALIATQLHVEDMKRVPEDKEEQAKNQRLDPKWLRTDEADDDDDGVCAGTAQGIVEQSRRTERWN